MCTTVVVRTWYSEREWEETNRGIDGNGDGEEEEGVAEKVSDCDEYSTR